MPESMSQFVVASQIVTAQGGGGWLDDAASGLEQSAVYVSDDVSGGAALQETLLQSIPDGGSIAVAVLPKDASLELPYSTYLLDRLFTGGDYDTLIIAVGEDLQADSQAIDGDEAMRIANQAERDSGGDVTAALIETVQQISAESPAMGDVPGSESQDSGTGVLLMPVIVGVAVLAAAGTAITAVVRRRRRRRRDAENEALPGAIHERLVRLRALAPLYSARGSGGDRIAAQTAADIDGLITNVEQLFGRVDAKADSGQREIAEVEYADKLGRLVAALDEDYLLDLLANPNLWEEPDERIQEVRDALDALSAQLLDNIRQVNARKGLHFQVALDSLVGREELRDWEREFKRSSGE